MVDTITFAKTDLSLTDYNWISTSQRSSTPTRCAFNPKDGEQVLFLINYFASSIDENISLERVHAIEQKIREMPADIRSEKAALNWITGSYLSRSI